jgi:hypothetical protein
MVNSKATSVAQYLKDLPPERRKVVSSVRDVIRKNLRPGFDESIAFGMIGYGVPLSRYPETYNGQPLGLAALAAQKNYYALYLFGVYADEAGGKRFRDEYRKTGKRLDMGKSCVRFKSLDDLPLDLIGRTIAASSVDDVITLYENARNRQPASRKPRRNPKAR